jgi:hypothetical protein
LEGAAEDVPNLLKVAGKYKIAVLRIHLLKNMKELINIQNFQAYFVAAKEENCEEAKMEARQFFAG